MSPCVSDCHAVSRPDGRADGTRDSRLARINRANRTGGRAGSSGAGERVRVGRQARPRHRSSLARWTHSYKPATTAAPSGARRALHVGLGNGLVPTSSDGLDTGHAGTARDGTAGRVTVWTGCGITGRSATAAARASAAVTVDIVRDRSHIRLHGRREALTD